MFANNCTINIRVLSWRDRLERLWINPYAMNMIQRLINHQTEYVFLQIIPLKVAVWKIP